MKINLKKATLIKRYKRFLADVTLEDGSTTTMHISNTGAMTGCATPNDQVFYSTSTNSKRKYPFSWEASLSQKGHWICVNTLRANQLVEEAINNNLLAELVGYQQLKREVKYGTENSKIDFLLQSPNKADTYIEVKSVTLLSSTKECTEQGYFPDAVTLRGQKHLRELALLAQQGHRAILLFAVLHCGINNVKPAAHIDAKYAELLAEAKNSGVEIIAYKANFKLINDELELSLSLPINVNIDAAFD